MFYTVKFVFETWDYYYVSIIVPVETDAHVMFEVKREEKFDIVKTPLEYLFYNEKNWQ